MYEIKHVTLQRGKQTKKRYVIEFTDPEQSILGEFLMVDVPLFSGEISDEITAVLRGDRRWIKGSGNRCSWDIDRHVSVISDVFIETGDDIPTMPTCTIQTEQLYDLVEMWLRKIGKNG
ncbi:MAG TPA: hypothetical protein VK085_13250 [Pseudogracilibacillus sp.]|nr:hypothetical protein [Pseudogracilibacillus sp.]